MKLQTILRTSICPAFAFLALSGLYSCDEDGLGLDGTDCSIVSLSLNSGETVLPVRIYPDSMVVVADYNQNMTAMTAMAEISEGATVEPSLASVKDWSAPMSFTVTAADRNSQKVYRYNVHRDALESYCKENVYLRTQEEVNEFGKNNYRRVRSIVVNDSEENPITDLSPLSSLMIVDNNFTVKGFHGETIAMDQLKEVATFDVNAESLVSVSASQLEEINNLYIGEISGDYNRGRELMDTLTHINFGSLKKIKGNLCMRFWNPAEDFAIHGFDNVEAIDGDIVFKFPTAHFKTFSKLTKVNNLMVCNMVKSFEGLENIKEVTGTFSTYFLLGVETLLPFAPEKVHTIRLLNNQKINSFEFCKNITHLYDFEVFGGYKIQSLAGLENLREVENEFKVGSTRITDLDALSNLERVGNSINIVSNRMLEDFSGLKKCLQNFEGEWTVRSNKVNPTIEEILGE